MLAFSRTTAIQASDVYILRLSPGLRPEGEPKPLTGDHRWNDSPTWLADGHEILYSSNRDGNRSLWIVNESGANSPRRLPFVGEDSLLPAVSRQAHRLVYAQWFQDINIWRMNLTGTAGTRGSSSMLISSSRLDANGDYSPDGRRIAFQSDRFGSFEIWICDSGGSHARPLTSFGHGHTGSPRWSPDGKSIAFDSNVEGQFQVYVAGAEGGAPKRLTDSAFNNIVPTWSRDGAWIYFTSTHRGATTEIWKMPSRGGKAIQVTRHGGLRAAESPDGRWLYYLKANWIQNDPSTLWQMPVDGGTEKKVLDGVLGRSFFITGQGIYYARREQPGGWSIRLFQPATGTEVNLAHVEKPAYLGFSVSPDGRSLLYAEIDQEGSDLMMVENFR